MTADTWLWTGSLTLAAGIVTPYAFAFYRRCRLDHERKAEAARLGLDRPMGQYPYIDPTRCVGCRSCVNACPEGDVLGVIGGTATVVNGLRCIGHAHCERACPLGAIEVGLGDVKSRADLPLLDDWNETSVPGLFVAGELAGLALVKNAVAQATRVMERISGRVAAGRKLGRAPEPPDAWDVVIVGAGPAGLSAAAAAKARGLECLVLEQEQDLGGTILHYPRRKLVLVQPVELALWGPIKQAEYSKERLLEIFRAITERHDLQVRFGERVTEVARREQCFVLRTPNGEHAARHVLLALGRRGSPRKLGVPGEELPKVTYRLQEADSYRGQRILVVGGGDSAVEAAIGLARDGRNEVTLSYRREKLVRIKKKNEDRFAELVRKGRVRTFFPSDVEEIRPEAVRLSTALGMLELPNDFVFVLIGGEPSLGLLRAAGVRFGGGHAADAVPGVCVAQNTARRPRPA